MVLVVCLLTLPIAQPKCTLVTCQLAELLFSKFWIVWWFRSLVTEVWGFNSPPPRASLAGTGLSDPSGLFQLCSSKIIIQTSMAFKLFKDGKAVHGCLWTALSIQTLPCVVVFTVHKVHQQSISISMLRSQSGIALGVFKPI